MTKSENEKRIYSLDLLRILAIFTIVLYHYQQVFDYTPSGLLNFSTSAFNCSLIVEFFFVLSGFLAFSDIAKLNMDLTFADFFKKKYTRLIPVILLPCVAYTVLCYIMRSTLGNGGWYFDTVVDIPASLTAMLGIQFWGVLDGNAINYPLWYVDVLVFCYILMAVIVKLAHKINISCIYGFIMVIFLGISLWNTQSMKPFANMFMARGYYAFFFGVMLAYLYERDVKKKFDRISFALISFAVSLGSFAIVISKPGWFGEYDRYIYTFITYPALILVFLNIRVRKAFDFKIIGITGKITYDIFVWHLVLFLLYNYLFKAGIVTMAPDSYMAMLIWFMASCVMGIVSYCLIDPLVIRLGKKVKELYF